MINGPGNLGHCPLRSERKKKFGIFIRGGTETRSQDKLSMKKKACVALNAKSKDQNGPAEGANYVVKG